MKKMVKASKFQSDMELWINEEPFCTLKQDEFGYYHIPKGYISDIQLSEGDKLIVQRVDHEVD